MKADVRQRGLIVYEKEAGDYRREDLERMAALAAQDFDDDRAAQVPNLFPVWTPGASYAAGARITDGAGRLYRVMRAHTAREDCPMGLDSSLYAKLGITAENAGTVAKWAPPAEGRDAYNKGDRVLYRGVVRESLVDGNAQAPDAYPAGWGKAR